MGSQIPDQSKQQNFPWEGKEGQERERGEGGRESKQEREVEDRCQLLPRRDSGFCHTERYLGIDHLAILQQTNFGTK